MSVELTNQNIDEDLDENLQSDENFKMIQRENEPQLRRIKKLERLRATFSEESLEIAQSDESLDSYQSGENPIFPSPIAISREEALCETCPKQNGRSFSGINEAYMSAENKFLTNGSYSNVERSVEYMKASPHHNGLRGSQSLRRETEKPPRLQKQTSRDRTPSGGPQLNNSDIGNCNGTTFVTKNGSTGCLDSMGVDVHEFLIKSLKSNSRDRSILLKLEHDMVKFINNQSIMFMKFPSMTSYHRMLVHRVAAYFGMDHNIDNSGTSVIINKTKKTRMPDGKFSDYILECDDLGSSKDEDIRRRSILKRMKNCQSLDHSNIQMRRSESWRDAKQRSFEEREVDYEKIRARIFSEQESPRSRNLRSRTKDRLVNQWQQRPWNSTDLGSLPGRSNTNPPVSIMSSSNLGEKSNSYSGITVLSRKHNNPSTDTYSTGSTNSSPSVFQSKSSDSLQNNKEGWGNTLESQPRLMPYMECRDVIGSSLSESLVHEKCHMVDLYEKQILIAVPAGFKVKPGTILTHPSTGFPYVTLEGQPVLYPGGKPLVVPSYPQVPMQYVVGQGGSPFNPQPQMGSQASNSNYEQGTSSNASTPVSSGVNQMTQPPPIYQQMDPTKHSYPQYQPPYQPAPVQLVYYPSPPMQTVQYGDSRNFNPISQASNLTNGFQSLSINSHTDQVNKKQENLTNTNNDQAENSNKDSEAVEPVIKDTQEQQITSQNEGKVPQTQNLTPTEAPKLNGDVSDISTTKQSNEQYTGPPRETPQPATTSVPPSSYYPSQTMKPYPLQSGVTGHPVVTPMYNGPHYQVDPHGKNPKMVPDMQDNFYFCQGNMNGYNLPPPQPTYYILAQNPAPYQYNNPVPYHNQVVYPHYPHPVAPHYPYQTYEQPSSTVVQPTDNPVQGMAMSSVPATNDAPQTTPDPAKDFFPVLIEGISDMDNVQLNSFAVKHGAKLMQVERESGEEQAANHDLYLLFSTEGAAANAISSHAGETPFALSALTDVEAITKLVNRAYAAN